MKKIFIILFSFMFCTLTIDALTCSEIKENVNNISYDVLRLYDFEEAKVEINFYGLNENYKVEVQNSYNDEVKTYTNNDFKDGILTFNSETVLEKINYRIRVYASDVNCTSNILKTYTFETPKYNSYITSSVCDGMYDTIDLCNPFYDTGNMTLKEFNEKVTELSDIINEPFKAKVIKFIKNYYLYVLIPFLIISIIYIVKIILVKRRKKKYV